ncbi:outer membrane beta-barrel protein [Bacteroides salyersiae]|uniref:outer membrane beta-barrel protein n=1 Tax=Bacteroides salyersiae TaxID=291644 RepID=UPI00189A190C|nr:outer membrane beta-barrel protein [Bacteroides salyersiae]
MKPVYKQIYVIVIILLCSSSIMAQRYSKGYFGVGWQYGGPTSNCFADKASGYGFYLDGGYYVNSFLSLGVFANYHNNYEYVPRRTYSIGGTETVTTDQQYCIRQLPFGASVRYYLFTGKW